MNLEMAGIGDRDRGHEIQWCVKEVGRNDLLGGSQHGVGAVMALGVSLRPEGRGRARVVESDGGRRAAIVALDHLCLDRWFAYPRVFDRAAAAPAADIINQTPVSKVAARRIRPDRLAATSQRRRKEEPAPLHRGASWSVARWSARRASGSPAERTSRR